MKPPMRYAGDRKDGKSVRAGRAKIAQDAAVSGRRGKLDGWNPYGRNCQEKYLRDIAFEDWGDTSTGQAQFLVR